MTKQLKRQCPYLPNNCTASIRKEDLSCYGICNVYKDWNLLISRYEDSFDTPPFNTQQVIKELKAKNGAVERLNYWLNQYNKPLYSWIDTVNESKKNKRTLFYYQNELKYYQPNRSENGEQNFDFVVFGHLSIPTIVYQDCFKEYENTPEFAYWNLEFEAKIMFEILKEQGQWEKKAVAASSSALFQATLHRIEEEEEKANSLLLANAFDIYKANNPHQYNKEIALLRIKNNLYKDGSFLVPKNCNVAKIYAEHLLLKPHLQELSNKHLDTSYWIHDIEKEENSQSFLSSASQIRQYGFYEVANAKVYTPLLAHILTVTFEARKIASKNALTLFVDGKDYIPSYKEGYQKGIAYFKDNYSVPPSVLYGAGAKNYIDDLHYNYCHTIHYKLYEGWQFVKTWYPLTLSHKVIKEYGYYAGIVSEVDNLIEKYPTVFATFDSCPLADIEEVEVLDTKSNQLKQALQQYSFLELPKVKTLTENSQNQLINLINAKETPYQIAMFDYLGFLTYLLEEHFTSKKKLYKEIPNIIKATERTIKGNILVLNPTSKEDKERYTSHTYKEQVEKDYYFLK